MVLKAHGIEEVSYHTVFNVLRNGDAKAIHVAGARGLRQYNNTQTMQIKRKSPTRPLLYASVDGWTAELLYQENGVYHNRLVVVVVLDPFNDYPLGYAIGERENVALIKQAMRNAIKHSAEMFGQMYTPYQVQSDRYGIKQLTPFYEAMTKYFTPAAVGNSKAKKIEPYFNIINHKYCQFEPNWGGHNVTSDPNNQPNVEWLDKNKKNMKTKTDVIRQIENIMEAERAIKGLQYKTKFIERTDDQKILLSEEQYYYLLGEVTKLPSRVHPMGITPQINNQEYYFDTFDHKLRQLSHLKFFTHYDPGDMSQCLAVSECSQFRLLLQEKYQPAMALADKAEYDSEYLKQVRDFNKTRKEDLTQKRIAAMTDAQELIESADKAALLRQEETALKLMFTYSGQQKEAIQNAKRLGTSKPEVPVEITTVEIERKAEQQRAKTIAEQHEEYLNSKIDFDQYLD